MFISYIYINWILPDKFILIFYHKLYLISREKFCFLAKIQTLLNINYNSGSISIPAKGGSCMRDKVNFNVVEKNKSDNIDDITKYIQAIINKLIIKEFVNSLGQ